MAAVTYFDRVCIANLAPDIMRELGLSRLQMSFVFSAFAVAYAVFEIPTAWWGERVGTRRVLTRIVLWWSAFTLATAAAFHYLALVIIRFLFGAGEAGAWPNAARTFSRWIPSAERGRVQGVFFAGAHLAGGLTPALVAWMKPHLGWRGVFVAFGLLGFLWAAAWHRWFRDDPGEHPKVNAAELEFIRSGRSMESHHGSLGALKHLMGSRNGLGLCLSYFANGYGFYFLITWLPTYLEQVRGMSKSGLSLFAGLPLILSVASDLFGGVATDKLTARFGLRAGRAGVGVAAYTLAAVAILAAAGTPSAAAAAVLIAVASAATMFTLGASWATCIDIGGDHAGVLSAAMNTSGQAGAVLSPILLAWIVSHAGGWAAPLYVMGGLYALAALAWLLVDPRRSRRYSESLTPVSR